MIAARSTRPRRMTRQQLSDHQKQVEDMVSKMGTTRLTHRAVLIGIQGSFTVLGVSERPSSERPSSKRPA